MYEKRAREILGTGVKEDNSLSSISSDRYVDWPLGGGDVEVIRLDGDFSLDQIEAIAWWVRNKS